MLWSAKPLLRWDPAYPLTGVSGGNWKGYDFSWDTYGLCRDSQGNVWSTSSSSTKLQKIAPSGSVLAEFDRGLTDAKSCVADRNDDIWVAYGEGAAAKVAHLKNDGSLVGSVVAGSGANGLSLDARGKVWVTNCFGNTASRIDPTQGPVGPDATTHVGVTDFTTADLGGSPFGYSDMTGSIRASGPGVGSWTGVFNSGDAASQWGQVQWSSWVCGNGALLVQASSSTDGTTYGSAVTATNGVTFTVPNGPYLRVIASFTRSSKGETPTLADVTVATKNRPLTAKTNAAPVVNAGLGFTTTLPNRGHLVGSVCDDGLPKGVLTSTWSKLSGPGSVTFVSPSSEVTDVIFATPGTYVLRLSGTDSVQTTTSDVTVTVLAANNPPVVNAGPNLAITLPTSATLTATATDDGQPTGSTLSTSWAKVSGPGTVTFASPTALSTTASFSLAGTYVVRFTAFDSLLSTSADVTITVSDPPPENQPPVVKAGSNVVASFGTVVGLTGLVTDDGLPAGAPLTQQWTQVSGPGVATFSAPTALATSVTFSAAGTYVLRLTASDTALSSSSELSVVLVTPSDAGVDPSPSENKPPTVSAGPNLAITLPSTSVTLSGSASDDGLPSGTLTTQWTKVSGPGTVTFASASSTTTNATMSVAGTYVLRLSASDGVFTAAADVQVDVHAAGSTNKAPVVKGGAAQTITLPTRTVTLTGTVTDDGKPTGAALASQWTVVSGPASVVFGTPKATSTLATFNAAGTYTLRLTVSDTELSGSGDTVVTVLAPTAPNTAPNVVAGPPQTITYPATTTATLAATISDDGLPVGGTLQHQWLQIDGPAVAAISGDVASFTAIGAYTFRVYALDGELLSSAISTVSVVAPTPPNAAPAANAGLAQTITLPSTAKLSATITDDGLPASGTLSVTWSKISGPGTVTFAPSNGALSDATFSTAGTYVLRITADDGALTASSDVTITVLPQNLAPVVSAGGDQTLTFPNKVTTLAGTVTDDGLPAGGTLTTVWSTVSGPVPARFWHPTQASTNVTFVSPGTYVLRLTADDSAKSASSNVTITVTAPVVGSLPVVSFADGTDGQQITKPTVISGSVSSGAWTLDVALGDEESTTFAGWRTIASGSNVVTNAALGTLDPTVMLNGAYTLRLRSTTDAGSVETFAGVTVARNMKVGTFALAFDDLVVPAPGLSLQVQRTYDNRDKGKGDFGVGWNLGVRNIRVEKSTVLGKLWYQSRDDSGFFTEYALEALRDPKVTVTFPSGKSYQFQMQASPSHSTLYPIISTDITFAPINGTVGSLIATDGMALTVVPGSLGLPGPCTLEDLSYNVWNPTRFTLTDEDGIQYTVNQGTGIESIRDLDGNVLTVTADGIKHSSGKNVTFKRDSQGRITEITDPNGKVMSYGYDALGNLATFSNAVGDTQKYAYDDNHNMLSTTDGRGITPANYGYDPAGRLTGVTDAFGKITTFTHDLTGKTETVTDPFGATTVYTYDDDGNVTQKVDANGKIWLSTYDANDNMLSETDPLGATKTYTYDVNNSKLTETDALGKTTTYTYGKNRKMTSRTDPLGRKTTYVIDFFGAHVLQQIDPAGGTTIYHYDANGQLETMTNPVGAVTTYVYSAEGLLLAETDALTHSTGYTYDAKGQRLTETKTRTRADGSTENVVTRWTYDDAGRVTMTTYPDLSTTETTYDRLGKAVEEKDQKGRVTKHTYDSLGRLSVTTYPDLTTETTTYDAVGRVSTRTDRGGHVTTYGYDLLGRQTTVLYADSSSTSTMYDDAGHVLTTTNENGHTTTYGYDLVGRRTTVTDALSHTTTMAYDFAGQLTSTTDPLSHSTSYTYDGAGRTLRTTYADGTHDDSTYDLAGERLTKTDQAGITTSYAYDLLGRLKTVTDALGHPTTYAYDELGNKTQQTDANLHTTKYVYDSLGRRLSKVLPMGQFDQTVYDVAGNVLSHTDNNGKVTTFTYDTNNRMLTRTPEASFGEVATSWTYTATGKRHTMVDATGTTTYTYDVRDRLLQKETPEGTLFYTRDATGHVKTTRSEQTDGVAVDYAWDKDERLATVTDRGPGTGTTGAVTTYGYDTAGRPLGWTQPNGVVTAFTYDTVNHLKTVSITNAASTTLASYSYTLSPTGNRLSVAEGSGRTIAWTYDTLYRLSSETITGAATANGAISYTYDNAGNRLTRTSSVPGITATTTTYDANDRTVGDSWNANGNMLTRDDRTQSFDSLDRLTSSMPSSGGSVHIYYDGDGNRVAEDLGGAFASYLVDEQNPTGYPQIVEERASGAVRKAYVFGRKPLSQRAKTGSTWANSYYGLDGHGSVTFLTDSTAAIADTWEYDAFGTVTARTGTTPNSILYSGEWMDADQGLQYLRARWYAPGMGKFLSVDPLGSVERGPAYRGRGDDGHPYVYASNSPLLTSDPTGLTDTEEEFAVTPIATTQALSITKSTISASQVLGPISVLWMMAHANQAPSTDLDKQLATTEENRRNTGLVRLGLGLDANLNVGRIGYRAWSAAMGFLTYDQIAPRMFGTEWNRIEYAMRVASEINFNMEGFTVPFKPRLKIEFGEPAGSASYTDTEYSLCRTVYAYKTHYWIGMDPYVGPHEF